MFPPHMLWKIKYTDFAVPSEDHEALNNVFQFPNIPWPAVMAEIRHQSVRQEEFPLVLAFGFGEEVLNQFWNVVYALTQRREIQRDDRKTVIEVLAKSAIFD